MGEIENLTTTTSAFPREETSFKWRIRNFSTVSGTNNCGVTLSTYFEAGEGVGFPSKWALELITSGRELHLRFRRVEPEGGVKSHLVSGQATLKACENPEEDVVSITMIRGSAWEKFEKLAVVTRRVLIGDELVIHFTFWLSDHKENASCSRKLMENARDELCTNLGTLLETGVGSDFEIQVKKSDGNIIKMKVHKAILVARSPVLQKMFESGMKETESGSMFIDDLSAECVNLMLKWIYTGLLDEDWKTVPDEIVVAADKYDLPCLRSFLDQYLNQACTLENALTLRKVARLHGLGMATKNVNKFLKTNIEEIQDY